MLVYFKIRHLQATPIYFFDNLLFHTSVYSGDSGKEKLIPLLQGPSDTKDLHSSKWLNESRKPESLLAPDLIAFTVQVPQCMDYCHSSGKYTSIHLFWIFFPSKIFKKALSFFPSLLSLPPLPSLLIFVHSSSFFHLCPLGYTLQLSSLKIQMKYFVSFLINDVFTNNNDFILFY